MPTLNPNGIALYLYRRTPAGFEFLQLRRSSTTGEYQQTWQIVYGGIEPGETAPQAALRELREETALLPAHLLDLFQIEYIETFYFRRDDAILMLPVFAAEVALDAPIALNHEHDAFRWVPTADIPTHFMWHTQREALRILLEQLLHPTLARPFLTINPHTIPPTPTT